MPINIIKEEQGLIISFNGKLDNIKCLTLQESILESIKDAKKVIFDLLCVEKISQMFFHLCNLVINHVKKENFNIINVDLELIKNYNINRFLNCS